MDQGLTLNNSTRHQRRPVQFLKVRLWFHDSSGIVELAYLVYRLADDDERPVGMFEARVKGGGEVQVAVSRIIWRRLLSAVRL